MVSAMSLRGRTYTEEIMDGDDYHEGEYQRCLEELEWINRLTSGYTPTLEAVERAYRLNGEEKLRVLDIGFGNGDTLRMIRRWADAKGFDIDLTGIDINPKAKRWAESATQPEMRIRFETADAFDVDEEYDLIINALMMHHLNDDEIVRLLRWMTDHSRVGWFVNDLHRHPVAFHFARFFTKAFGFGRLVRNDAPLSVARSFRPEDWDHYLERAGIARSSVRLRWHWAFRYGLFCHSFDAKADQ